MTDFIIKSTISLFVLLAVYYLFLEKEKMYRFNRFYLLFCIVFSFIIPFITIEIVQEITNPVVQTFPQQFQTQIITEAATDYLPYIIYSCYAVVALLLSIRFLLNILKITSHIKKNPAVNYKNARLVLLEEKTLPHTFLNTVFINRSDYENRNIEAELYTHELAHVTQKHTLDVLFIETVKTIFWFNPIFIFYKKAIQLNHEFLADEKVVDSYNNVPFYQNLLLSKAKEIPKYALASNLNYSITKKRLIMMTKTTARATALLKKALLVPTLCGLVFFICVENIAQVKNVLPKTIENNTETDKKRDRYYAGVHIKIKDYINNVTIDKPYEELSLEQKREYMLYVPEPYVKKSPTQKEFDNFKNGKTYAIWIDGKHVPNSNLKNYQRSELVWFSGSSVLKNARSKKFPQPFQYWFATSKYFDKNLKDNHLKFGGPIYTATMYNEKTPKSIIAGVKKEFESVSESPVGGQSDEIVQQAEIQPEFPGGMAAFYKYIGENFKIPANFKGKGMIMASFVVEKNGSLSDIKILKEPAEGIGKEAARVLEKSPKWIPGKKDGKDVRIQYSIPIMIEQTR